MFNMELWLLTEMKIQAVTANIVQTRTQFFGRDPLRYAFMIPADVGTTVFYGFGNDPNLAAGSASQASNSKPVINRMDIGDLICEPIWLWVASGTSGLPITTVSFDPTRWRIYHEFAREYLSKFNTL